MQKAVGKRIRELRLARGMTQEAVAEKAKIHTKYYGSIERGEVNLTISTVERISTALGVKPSALLLESDTPSKTATRAEVRHLVDTIVEHADEDKLQRLRVFLETVFR